MRRNKDRGGRFDPPSLSPCTNTPPWAGLTKKYDGFKKHWRVLRQVVVPSFIWKSAMSFTWILQEFQLKHSSEYLDWFSLNSWRIQTKLRSIFWMIFSQNCSTFHPTQLNDSAEPLEGFRQIFFRIHQKLLIHSPWTPEGFSWNSWMISVWNSAFRPFNYLLLQVKFFQYSVKTFLMIKLKLLMHSA